MYFLKGNISAEDKIEWFTKISLPRVGSVLVVAVMDEYNHTVIDWDILF
jgi:hypothetical protein